MSRDAPQSLESRVLYDTGPRIQIVATGDPTLGGLSLTVGESDPLVMSREVADKLFKALGEAIARRRAIDHQ